MFCELRSDDDRRGRCDRSDDVHHHRMRWRLLFPRVTYYRFISSDCKQAFISNHTTRFFTQLQKLHATRFLKVFISSTLSLRFNGRFFPGGPRLAGIRMFPFCILLEVVVTNGATRRAKFQLNLHHQQTNTQLFFTSRMPFLSPNQQCQSTEGSYFLLFCLYGLYFL